LGHLLRKTSYNTLIIEKPCWRSSWEKKRGVGNEGKSMRRAPETRNTCITLSEHLEKYRKLLDHRNLPTRESHGTQWMVIEPLPYSLVEVV